MEYNREWVLITLRMEGYIMESGRIVKFRVKELIIL